MGGVVGYALGGVAGATVGATADAFGNIGSAEREKQRNDAINAAKNKAWEDSEAQLNARDAALKPWETAQLRYDQAGRPKYVQAKSLIDPTTGLLMDQYNLKAENLLEDTQNDLSKINLNTDALKELRKRGLSTGNSEWANLMLQKAELDQKSQREGMVKSQATAGAQARSALASRGGLRGGAAERIARGGMLQGQQMNQQLGMQAAQNRLGIMTEDEKQRVGILQALPGMEVQALQPEFEKAKMTGQARQADIQNRSNTSQFNILQALADKKQRDAAAMAEYQSAMSGWAANKQADATMDAGKRDKFLGIF